MFHDAILMENDSRAWTKGIGLISVASVISLWCVYSILDYAPFPILQLRQYLLAPPPLRPAAVEVISVQRLSSVKIHFVPKTLYAPTTVPRNIASIVEAIPPSVVLGTVTGVIPPAESQISTPLVVAPPPPEREERRKEESIVNRVQVGGDLQAAKLIFQPKPVYPPLARQARIQGTVHLEALISNDGTIENLKVMSGPPLLIQAAVDAVAQWRYRPTSLNGVPVEVFTTIDVNFTLSQ